MLPCMNNGNYEQYPMSGLPTNGGYNYYFDRQYYDLEKGYTVLNTIFNAKITLPAGFSFNSILLLVISGSMTVIGVLQPLVLRLR